MEKLFDIGGVSVSRRTVLQGSAAAIVLAATGRQAFAATDLTVWTPGGSPSFCEVHTKIVNDFIAKAGGGAGQLQCGIGAAGEFAQALLASIAGGNPPDVALVWDSPIALGVQGAFLPLDEYMAKSSVINSANWPPALLATCQFKNQTFGLPVAAGTFGMLYNQEMFDAKGIPSDRASFPKTWDELRKLSKEFTKWDGDRLEVAGFVPPRETESLPIWSALNGSQVFDSANLRYTLNSPENIAMFEYFVAWLDEEYKGDINAVDRSGQFRTIYQSGDGQLPAFQEGRQAGLESGSWAQGDLYATDMAFTKWNFASFPVGPAGKSTVSGTWPNWFAVPKGTRDINAAIGYLEYISETGVVEWYRRNPDLPANLKAADVVPDIVVQKRGDEFAKDATAFLKGQRDVAVPMWNSPVQSFGQDQITKAIEKIYLKSATPKEALDEAQTLTQAELEKVLK